MTVVAILGILISILFVAIPKVRQRANSAKCTANLRELFHIFNVYVADWGHWPTMNIEDSNHPSNRGGDRWFNSFITQEYLPTHIEVRDGYTCMISDSLICPSNEANPGSRYPWMSSPYMWFPNYALNAYWGAGEGGSPVRPATLTNPSAILLIDTLSNPNGGACLYPNSDAAWSRSSCVIPRRLHSGGAHALLANGAIITVSPETHPDIEEQRYWDPRFSE